MAAPRQDLPSLTPLRGIAALAVILGHLGGPQGWAKDPILFAIIGRGYLAVDLFFVLSGFVLAHVHGGAAASGLSIRFVGRFLWARFARLYPTYAAVTLLVAAMSVAAGGPSAGALATNLAMAQVPWTSAPSLVFVAWSVSAEWNAYLLFPVAAPLLLRCGARLGFALYAAMGIAILAAASLQWFGPWGGVITGWGALARAVPQFLMGMLLYRAYRAGFLRGLWASDLMLAAIAAGIAAVVALGLGDGVAVMLFPPLILAAVSNRGAGGRMLNARPLRWLGDISYSLYLTQVFVFAAIWRVAPTPVAKLLGPWEAALAGTLLALAVGALFHRTVEEPARPHPPARAPRNPRRPLAGSAGAGLAISPAARTSPGAPLATARSGDIGRTSCWATARASCSAP
jgi:peptidoglycan/LPS O-acetylase OafA/YrhL